MKISKPFCLSIQVRPYRWRGQARIGLSAAILVDMRKGYPVLQNEAGLWSFVAEHLDSEGILDLGMPKPQAEFLVSGHAYTAHSEDKTQCRVRVQVNDRVKELQVYGDRYFLDNRVTPAQPFEQMSLGWRNAYGGPGFANNPMGKGTVEEMVNGVRARRMPNIEWPNHPIRHFRDTIHPAGLGAQSITWPVRFGKVGTYSEEWKKTDAPGFFPDMDPSLFNAAMADQIFDGQTQLPPNTEYRVWNMHPEKPCWQGTVPAWQARCLIELQKSAGSAPELHDVELAPTTLWLVPHLESYIVLFHGTLPCWYDDGDEIRHILGALEWKYSPRTHDHYLQYMQTRLNHDESALLAYEDEQLLPENLKTAGFDIKPDLNGAMWEKQHRLQRYLLLHARADLQTMGLDAEHYLPEFVGPRPQPTLAQLLEKQKKRDVFAREQREELLAVKTAAKRFKQSDGKDKALPALLGEPDFLKRMDELNARIQVPDLETDRNGRALDALLSQIREAQAAQDNVAMLERQQRRGFLFSAQYRSGTYVLDEVVARERRQQALEAAKKGGNLHGMDLTGADLRRVEFHNCDLSQTVLMRADMTESIFDNCDFSEAVLFSGIFRKTQFRNCRLHTANLSRTRYEGVAFVDCRFHQAIIDDASFSACDFAGAAFSESVLRNLRFENTTMTGMSLDASVMLSCVLDHVAAEQANLNKCAFYECTFTDSAFVDASLTRCAFALCEMSGMSFAQSHMSAFTLIADKPLVNCDFSGAQISDGSMRGLHFLQPRFVQTTIRNTDCSKSLFEQADCRGMETPDGVFMRTEFRHSDFTAANLMTGLFRKSTFVHANFRKVNFFRADFAESLIDADSLHTDNFTRQIQLEPTQRGNPL
ncbi:hypothetical protein W822_08020 [Advenella kashmirensis W13003]|uniref:DUF2169 domain-containing protein n=1 Tax=Advenella kashmirensis W13003 TaxID=1424334 RepID=V8QTY2_9BURK|nr:DUF2169 domain-containing protein [Advenella kashmirensis]ETF02780.1 hypothetical protein W822_08020 [Advenella kashmirensis W13003]